MPFFGKKKKAGTDQQQLVENRNQASGGATASAREPSPPEFDYGLLSPEREADQARRAAAHTRAVTTAQAAQAKPMTLEEAGRYYHERGLISPGRRTSALQLVHAYFEKKKVKHYDQAVKAEFLQYVGKKGYLPQDNTIDPRTLRHAYQGVAPTIIPDTLVEVLEEVGAEVNQKHQKK
jgi:hypothetical protein